MQTMQLIRSRIMQITIQCKPPDAEKELGDWCTDKAREDPVTTKEALCCVSGCNNYAYWVCRVCLEEGFCKACYKYNTADIMQRYRLLRPCDLCKNSHHTMCRKNVVRDGDTRSRCDDCIKSGRTRMDPTRQIQSAPWRNKSGDECLTNHEV